MTETETVFPGGFGGGEPIKTFPEALEKDIGNILGSFLVSAEGSDGSKGYFVMDREALLYELLEYITNERQDHKTF